MLKFMKVLAQKDIRVTIRVVLLTKLFVFMIDIVNQLLFLEVKRLLMNLLKQILKEFKYCKKIMKKHFNKNLTISEEEEQF